MLIEVKKKLIANGDQVRTEYELDIDQFSDSFAQEFLDWLTPKDEGLATVLMHNEVLQKLLNNAD